MLQILCHNDLRLSCAREQAHLVLSPSARLRIITLILTGRAYPFCQIC